MPASKTDIIRSCYGAYESGDRKVLEDLLTEDFRFTSPYDNAIDKAEYFKRCWPNHELIKEHILENIVIDGDTAFALYKAVTNDAKQFRNTEFFTFEGDRIRSVHVFFGETYRDGVFVPQAAPSK